MANPHAPEELARLTTLVHVIGGWLLALLAVLLLIEIVRGTPRGMARLAWPAVGVTLGFGLASYVFFHMLLDHEVSPFLLPEQVQHQALGLTMGLGSLAELLRRRAASQARAWRAAFPVGIVAVGIIFTMHRQADIEAVLVHWVLASTLILAGLALLAPILAGEEAKTTRVLGVLLLLGASAQLIFYEETPPAMGVHGAAHEAGAAGLED